MTVNLVNQFGELMSVDFGDRGRCEHGHLLPIAHDWTECIQCEEEWNREMMRLLWLEHSELVAFSRIEE